MMLRACHTLGPKYNAPSYNDAHSEEVVMTKYFAALLVMFFIAWPSFAADPNGYTAQYECRAGGPYCNVDVAKLVSRACDQVVTVSTPWSQINWSNNTICIEAGNHTSKGTLTIPSSASGSSGSFKVLRYYRTDDNNDEPWKQSAANQAKIRNFDVTGNYWIIHRITVNANGGDNKSNFWGTNYILNRMLLENMIGAHGSFIVAFHGAVDNATIQNSVIRNAGLTGTSGADQNCVVNAAGKNVHIVNNEIYHCQGDAIATPANNPSGVPGFVVENNDLYSTPARYSDGFGNLTPTGDYGCSENAIDLKTGGQVAALYSRIIHNRMWGFRKTDFNCGGSGSSGEALVFHESPELTVKNSYGLIQNNIIFDSPWGITSPNGSPDHYSIIGNIFWNIQDATRTIEYAVDTKGGTDHEIYLNTFIDTNRGVKTNGSNIDVRCNVFISSGAMSASGTGIEFDYNVFFSTPVYTTTTLLTNIVGTKASDSKNVEFCFTRKLRTGPEVICIPNVRATSTSPHAAACDRDIGSRPNLGISNTQLLGF